MSTREVGVPSSREVEAILFRQGLLSAVNGAPYAGQDTRGSDQGEWRAHVNDGIACWRVNEFSTPPWSAYGARAACVRVSHRARLPRSAVVVWFMMMLRIAKIRTTHAAPTPHSYAPSAPPLVSLSRRSPTLVKYGIL